MVNRLIVAAVQANPTVGALRANEDLARERLAEATAAGADIALFSELFLSGYPPEDLALRPALWRDARGAVERLAMETAGGCAAVIGTVWPPATPDGRPRNALAFLADGEIQEVAFKCELPNYGVFDEMRIFQAGEEPTVASFRGVRLGLAVCEDIWWPKVAYALKDQGAEILLVANGSPYSRTIDDERLVMARARAVDTSLPLIYVNQVGGQDELVFDGGSFAVSHEGEEVMRLPMFVDTLALSTWTRGPEGWTCVQAPVTPFCDPTEEIYRAMVLGLRDYVRKSGFPGVILGLSGGLDSAVTAAAAADALGAEAVRGVMLPSRFTSAESREDAAACARALGIGLDEMAIGPAVAAIEAMLAPTFAGRAPDRTEENIQARARGLALMALSNKLGLMLLTTGNKSEMAVGYATLYGDMCGGYSVLKDLYKTDVYALAAWRNANDPFGVAQAPIPERILTKPPSAELRANQTDQDSLPPYVELDDILFALVEEEATVDAIVGRGHAPETVAKVERLLHASEFKRRQAPPGVKIGGKAFGRDRRYPLVNAFRDTLSED